MGMERKIVEKWQNAEKTAQNPIQKVIVYKGKRIKYNEGNLKKYNRGDSDEEMEQEDNRKILKA